MEVRPFRIEIPQSAIDNLNSRLAQSRFPDEIPGSDWEYGADLSYMKELTKYWRSEFDWRKEEAKLNAFHHFRTTVDGTVVHFIQERSASTNALPLILTHGWPGSFAELLKIIPMLTDVFDVIVPSIPGYGFSGKPTSKGMNAFAIAELWKKLMLGLGYERFGAHGGDWGASVSACLGYLYPEHVIGVHLNYIPGSYSPYVGPETRPMTETEKQFLADDDAWHETEGGYSHQQGTKPQTLAYALNDSPAGLAAWIVEKFRDWGDCDGDIEARFTKDELLTNISIYWFTETIHSSMRLYYEGRRCPLRFGKGENMKAPCGVIRFAKEAPFPPREWVERFFDVRRWKQHPTGGHFAAMEEPEALANDIRDFFASLRGESSRTAIHLEREIQT